MNYDLCEDRFPLWTSDGWMNVNSICGEIHGWYVIFRWLQELWQFSLAIVKDGEVNGENSGSRSGTYPDLSDFTSTSENLTKRELCPLMRLDTFPLTASLMYCMYTVNSRTQTKWGIYSAFRRWALAWSIKRMGMQIYYIILCKLAVVIGFSVGGIHDATSITQNDQSYFMKLQTSFLLPSSSWLYTVLEWGVVELHSRPFKPLRSQIWHRIRIIYCNITRSSSWVIIWYWKLDGRNKIYLRMKMRNY